MKLAVERSVKSQRRTSKLIAHSSNNNTSPRRDNSILKLFSGVPLAVAEKSEKSMLRPPTTKNGAKRSSSNSSLNHKNSNSPVIASHPHSPHRQHQHWFLVITLIFTIISTNCFYYCVANVDANRFKRDVNLNTTTTKAIIEEAAKDIIPQNRQLGGGATATETNATPSNILNNDTILQTRFRGSRTLNNTEHKLQINGFRVEASNNEVELGEDGVPSLLSNSEFTIRVFGVGMTYDTIIAFTVHPNEYGLACQLPSTTFFKPEKDSVTGISAVYKVSLPKESKEFYFCAKNDPNVDAKVISEESVPLMHQGSYTWNQIRSYELLLPVWVSIIIIVVCLSFSALFSGLNLGLMSLDKTELKILANTGKMKERKYAKIIQPVRDRGNYLLCSILLGNVLVNSIFTILLDGLTSGLFAVIFSTLAIVLFGEISPQAICSRHGLAIGAKTIFITRTVMILTFPLSYPISKFLDWCLGEEIGNVYNRERLKELVRVTTGINDLDKNEVNIISGALELRKKTVADVMTNIEDAFMLPLDAVLDFETVSEIMKSGYSRVPVYDGDKRNIVSLLFIKDLAFVDTDDNTPLRTLCEFYQNQVHFVFEDHPLDTMFNQFKDGSYCHIAFVHRVNNEGDGDPFYETVGLVTLEDVIEELIQSEIVDETDVYVDNRSKLKRHRNKKQDFTVFAERRDNQSIRISPQLALATYQYLSTAVDPFKKDTISETILRRLLNQDIIHNIKFKGKEKNDPSLFIYQQGKPVDFFVLILEGRVEVTVGKENLLFESGPFTYFGIQALLQNVVTDSPTQPQLMGSLQSLHLDAKIRQTFVPDYSVRAASDVIYIAIKRNLYLTAKKATLLEKSRKAGTDPNEIIDDEVEKLLHSLNEDDKHIRANHHSSSHKLASPTNGGSATGTPSLNDLSQQSHNTAAAQLNSQGSADIIDGISLSSQNTSDPANNRERDHDNNNHIHHQNSSDNDNVATAPLLPKPVLEFSK